MADLLTDLTPFEAGRYEDIDLDRLTSYAISLLLERHVHITFESIVVALFRMFPSKFGLVGYDQYPDAARVNRALLHCLPKYRNYVAGSARSGYYLTNDGVGAAEDARRLLESGREPNQAKRKRAGTPRGVADQFMLEVAESPGFKAFSSGGREAIEEYDLRRLVHAGPEATAGLIRGRLEELMEYARQTGRKDVTGYLNWLSAKFNGSGDVNGHSGEIPR